MPNTSRSNTSRYHFIDALRGLAIAMMFIYHFCFDLNYYRFIHINFYSAPFWLNFRTLIVSLFLTLVGVSLYLSTRHGLRLKPFLQRLALLLGFALLVSVASYFTFPDSYIFFGILHFIALASILGLLFIKFYYLNLVLGIVIIIAGTQIKTTLFDIPYLQWLGMMTHKPITEDYVPLFPWFGLILIGIFLARFIFTKPSENIIFNWQPTHTVTRTLCFGGRHSLIIYMLHQPIFLGILYLFHML